MKTTTNFGGSQFELISKNNLNGIKCKEGKTLAMSVLNAIQATDKQSGIIARKVYELSIMFTEKTLNKDNCDCKNLQEFGEKYLGIGKAQIYNLAKAGSFIETLCINGKEVTADTFTFELWNHDETAEVKPFSNTQLIALAYFIGQHSKSDAREAALKDLIYKKHEIRSDMSVTAIKQRLADYIDKVENAPTTTAQGAQGAQGAQDNAQGAQGAQGAQDSTQGAQGAQDEKREFKLTLTKEEFSRMQKELRGIYGTAKEADKKAMVYIAYLIDQLDNIVK